jgi:methyl-accepting chemotaxis protein
MKLLKTNAGRSRAGDLIFFFCVGVILLMRAPAALGQTEANYTAAELAGMRELETIASASAQVLNMHMSYAVSDVLIWSNIFGGLKEALNAPEAGVGSNQVLRVWLSSSGIYDAALLLDKDGKCVAASPESLVNLEFSGDPNFKEALAGKLSISDAHKSALLTELDPKSHGWTVAIAALVKVGDTPEGVLLCFLKWSVLEQLLNIPVAKTGYVYVLNRENRVIVHPHKMILGTNLGDPKINLASMDDAVRKKARYHSYEWKNPMTRWSETKFVGLAYPQGYGQFPGLGWTVGAGASRDELVETSPFWKALGRFVGALKERGANK